MSKWLKFNQLWQLTSALFREIIREPGVLFWGILFPILMSLGLGLAFTKKSDVIRKVAIINISEKSTEGSEISAVAGFLKFIHNSFTDHKAAPYARGGIERGI